MNYKFDIEGMHCNACAELITMELEDKEFQNINIDREKNIGTFSSEKEENEVVSVLEDAFKNLPDYRYSKLRPEV